MRRALLASSLALLLLAAPASFVLAQDDDARALLARGEETEKSKLEDAVSVYRKLLEKFPGSPQAARAHLRMGLCLAKLGKTEEARSHLREARKLGKDDEEVQKETEKALIALPPPPEPRKDEPKKPEAPKPPPAPETGPRAELQAEIEKLDAEKRELTKKAQDLEDAGKTTEAYQVRAELDKKVAQIEKKKKELLGMRGGGRPMLPGREQRKEDRKERKNDPEAKPAEKSKLMLHRKEDFEAAARNKLQEALEAIAHNRPQDVALALGEYHRLRREAEQLGKKAETGKERASLEDGLKKSREAVAAADKAGNGDAAKHAREELAQAEKALRDFDAASNDADQKQKIERLAGELKRRGAQPFEVEVRVGFAKRELQLDEEHRQAVATVQREIEEKKVAEPEGRERMVRLDREHHRKIERLRDEVENKVHERGCQEMEKELARRADEMRKNGVADTEIEQKIAANRKEIETRIPGRKSEAGPKVAETSGAPEGEGRKKVQELIEENRRLRKRVEELEKENAVLKKKPAAGPFDTTVPK